MNDSTIGRNYAETLLILAKKQGQQEEWGALIDAIAVAMQEDRTLKTFLESPKLAASQKIEILDKALGKRVPPVFLRFLETVIAKRRQMLIPAIATEYRGLIDESEDRLHASVIVAREPTESEREALVKVGDTVMDGSVRRRLATLRSRMLSTVTR
jgi:F-type H+-transporting ATPase subunit delta